MHFTLSVENDVQFTMGKRLNTKVEMPVFKHMKEISICDTCDTNCEVQCTANWDNKDCPLVGKVSEFRLLIVLL